MDRYKDGQNIYSHFSIAFDRSDKKKLYKMWDKIIETNRWTEGPFVEKFENLWQTWNGLPAVAFSSWSGAAITCLEFIGVKKKTVLCPSNTFMATPLSVLRTGGKVEFVDCNRDDLCMSFHDLCRKVEKHKPVAVWLVHIGGHIAFQVERIAEFCKDRGVWLIEDCAHAHGASWHGRKPGSWGDAGIYSFYPTKTISTGEGGMLVTRHESLVEFSRSFRNYGKPDFSVKGLNFRMSEFTAALGCVQVKRMEKIVNWKKEYAKKILDPMFERRVKLRRGMESGYYKYIVFKEINNSTGKVYEMPCHRIMSHKIKLPNTDWISTHHWCVPIYYHGNKLPCPLDEASIASQRQKCRE